MKVIDIIESRERCAEAGWHAYDFLLDEPVSESLIKNLRTFGSLTYLPMLKKPFFKVESHYYIIKGILEDSFFRMAVHRDYLEELDRVKDFLKGVFMDINGNTIKYKDEAQKWAQAFPLGNGHMGAMVYGGIQKERIDFSENTFFSGSRSEDNHQENSSTFFYKMRESIKRGDYQAAHQDANSYIGVRNNYGTNLPVGYLTIESAIDTSEKGDYQRSLDLNTGIAKSSYSSSTQTINRRAWVSHPARIFVYEIKTYMPLSGYISYNNHNDNGSVSYRANGFTIKTQALEDMHCDTKVGVSLWGQGHVISDGIITATDAGIHFKNATKIILYVAMGTDFSMNGILESDPAKDLAALLDAAISQSLDELRQQHIDDVNRLMGRCFLEIIEDNNVKNQIIPFLFQYGRYLLISASRATSILPAHLQGIWNDNVACRIGWTCDMHLDINTQMNYWPAYVTNLSETTTPLFSWIANSLVPSGRRTTKESYGLAGWVAELVSNAWGYTAPYWAVPISPCPTGGLWIVTHMWEHYLFTKDEQFLRELAFPIFEESVCFFSEYVFLDENGFYTCGPSISPENSFLVEGKSYQISNGCTYEILMIRELFGIYVKACEQLDLQNTMYQKVSQILPLLLPYSIDEDGSLKEWSHSYPEADRQHRHTSHLLGVFPFAQITKEQTPDLVIAAQKTLEKKLYPKENWEDTGWARSLMMLYEARFANGEAALVHIECMLSKLLEKNGMIIHPPTRGADAFDNVYELDGNTGLTSCIAEMLVQSHADYIELLPALPNKWTAGKVTGLRARGNIEIDVTWADKQLKKVRLYSNENTTIKIRYGSSIKEVTLVAGVVDLANFS